MNQSYVKNSDYEILTPNGWESFDGVVFNADVNKSSKKIIFEDGSSVTATDDHRFFSNGNEIKVSELKVGDYIDSVKNKKKISQIKDIMLQHTYEIFNAENHVIVVNSDILSHQCDEFSYVSPNIAEEFWTSISPTLSTGGAAIITSTPNTDEDTFATIWKQANEKFDEYGNESILGKNGFFAFRARWDEHPDRDEKWRTDEMNRIGEERFRREFDCDFISGDETLINSIVLSELVGIDPIFKMGQTRWYKKPSASNMYVIALDPAMGTGADNAAIQVYELPSYEQIAEWQHNSTNIPGQVRILRNICEYIASETGTTSNIYWSVENNGLGEAALIVIQDLGEENIPGLFVSEPIRKGHIRKFRRGFNTTFSAKISACSRLKTLVENTQLKIKSKSLISELKNFVATGSSYNAKRGTTDDLISASLLAIRMMAVLKDWDPRVYDTFKQIENEEDYEPPMPIFISRTV